MRNFKPAVLIALTICAIIAVSCATKNPNAGKPGEPPYIVNPNINAVSNSVAAGAAMAAPINPYAAPTDLAIKLVFGIVGALASGFVVAKNKGAVVDALAAGVVKQGPAATQGVLDHASTTSAYTAVADAINANTGVNQTNTGAVKTG